MVQRLTAAVVLAGLLGIAGCQSGSALTGTWQGREASAQARPTFQFASITFAPDGTYTSQMSYGDHMMAESGTWTLDNDTLTVTGMKSAEVRTYQVKVKGDELSVTDPQSKIVAVLGRLHGGRHGSESAPATRPAGR